MIPSGTFRKVGLVKLALALLKDTPFLLYFRNSAIIATGNMLLTLLVASLGAYGFVRFRFRGRSAMLVAMLVAYTIPSP